MAAQGKPTARKRRSRRTTGHDALTTVRLSSELRERVDTWAAKQKHKPARPEAIRRLVELGLETTHRRDSLMNRTTKATEMAAQEIDRLSDPSATDEERQLRKRRLIKGPKELRDIRKQSRQD
jgi:predicted transcriptional regulator